MQTIINSSLLIWLGISMSACDQPDPAQWRAKQHLPPVGFIANVSTGQTLFTSKCARCHGSNAMGTQSGPALIHSIYSPQRHADLAFHWAVRDGVKQHHWNFGNMPALPDVSPEETGHIVAFIRRQQQLAGIK